MDEWDEKEQLQRKPSKTPLMIFGGLTIGMMLFVAPFFKKGVPFMPTTNEKSKIVFQVLEELSKKQHLKFVDLGSGDGRLVLAAAKHRGSIQFTPVGVERNLSLFLISSMKSIFSKSRFVRKSFWDFDTRPFDVVYIFGIPALMGQFAKKLEAQPKGSFVITNKFPLPGWTPLLVQKEIFVYRL